MQVIPGKALSLEELKQGGPFTSEAGTTLTVCNKWVQEAVLGDRVGRQTLGPEDGGP
jgi:hypothetical protein